jgi:molybdopterin synthase catalytic subunit
VVTTSSHREAAFQAAEFLMDYLKTRAPFWKKEATGDGNAWVAAKDADDQAADRWTLR